MAVNYDLPVVCRVGNEEYPIRGKGDYRVILDVIAAMNDQELTEQQRIFAALFIFYENGDIPADTEAAIKEMFAFINRGEPEENSGTAQKVMDWEQDFPILIAPINRVLGKEVRALPYLHWWTFISAYMEIGECTFSFIVGIREKRRKGVKLEKYEREFYEANRQLVDLKNSNLTKAESDWLNELLGGADNGL